MSRGSWSISTSGGKRKELVRVGDIKAEMIISDTRVAVACLNYNRAGGVGEQE